MSTGTIFSVLGQISRIQCNACDETHLQSRSQQQCQEDGLHLKAVLVASLNAVERIAVLL